MESDSLMVTTVDKGVSDKGVSEHNIDKWRGAIQKTSGHLDQYQTQKRYISTRCLCFSVFRFEQDAMGSCKMSEALSSEVTWVIELCDC